VLLETIIPEQTAMDGFEVEHDSLELVARQWSSTQGRSFTRISRLIPFF
jgi:hypothetical protein